MSRILFRGVELDGQSDLDVLVSGGVVAAIGHDLASPGAEVIDAEGGALVPGLADHHLHLHAMAAQAASTRCGPPSVRTPAALTDALGRATADKHGWVRGVGYIETVAGELNCTSLDALHSARPVRVQHRSGAMWILNSRAADAVGLSTADHPGIERTADGTPTGRLWRADTWLRDRLPDNGPPDLSAIGHALTRLGITRITDATPDLAPSSVSSILDAVHSGSLRQRVHLLGTPIGHAILDARAGHRQSSDERVSIGPYKIVLADSDPPDLTELAALITRLHHGGRPFAAHCVSRENLLILLAALDEVGAIPGDRVEHGALIPTESISDIRRHGLTVVTQPGFLADRGDDYLRDVDPRDVGDLYRCRTLLDSGVPVGLSSDAPYGPLDPWANMRAAVDRKTQSGSVVSEFEAVSAAHAFAGHLAPLTDPGGPPAAIRIGGPADVVLLHAPLAEVLAAPSADAVRLTHLP